MSKKVAVIASILKPVDDTRLYEKLGLSMGESNKYQVNIIGFAVKNAPNHADMVFHCLYHGPRIGTARLLAPWKFMVKLFQIRPSLTVVCTPELLLPAAFYTLFTRTSLWYDVQENYQRNIRYQPSYSVLAKPILKLATWMAETFTIPFVDHYLLAERGYAIELPFVKNKHTILENKFRRLTIIPQPNTKEKVRFVFTGTVSKENGILQAITLVQALHAIQYPVQLVIVGQVPDSDLLDHIEKIIDSYHDNLIRLVGGRTLVPHQTILEHAVSADFGLVAHQPNPSTENCIPTKIYEYLGLRLPMLLQRHELWEAVVSSYDAALVLDYNNFRPQDLWQSLMDHNFYIKKPGPEITWEQESKKLLALL